MLAPWSITLLALIPAGGAVAGGLLASFYRPSRGVASFIGHFVAGIVIAAVAVELLPKITGQGERWTVALGFLAGVAVMLALHALSHVAGKVGRRQKFPVGLAFGSAIDLFIDGILIGLAFIAGGKSGAFIAASLSFCAFFLGLSISSTMSQNQSSKGLQITTIVLIALTIPLGALLGALVIERLPAQIMLETLAFGVAALLYLGVEELLGEAHQYHDTPLITGAFFLGFLLILLFKF